LMANLMPSGAFKSRLFFWRKNELIIKSET
jgi:hypothetical protein